MNTWSLLLIMLFGMGALATRDRADAAEAPIELERIVNEDGTGAVAFHVQRDRLERQPAWNPDAEACPFPMTAAIDAAEQWRRKIVETRELGISTIGVIRSHRGGVVRWYYRMQFAAPHGQKAVPPKPEKVIIILFDGSIIEGTRSTK